MNKQRNILIDVDSSTTKEANTNPNNILPTSPMKTRALGKLKGRKPIQPATKTVLIKKISWAFSIKWEKYAIRPKPTEPINPAIPLIPSIKL
ncbi:MAG TPA: hypothetical protein VJ024_08520 [Thermodesulfovibrionales bacterium]|nr:hypothetical protein [Thermodesulfovibrionales bacterium]